MRFVGAVVSKGIARAEISESQFFQLTKQVSHKGTGTAIDYS